MTCYKAKNMMRKELLGFLTPSEIVKTALLCREMYTFVDANRIKMDGKPSFHLMVIEI